MSRQRKTQILLVITALAIGLIFAGILGTSVVSAQGPGGGATPYPGQGNPGWGAGNMMGGHGMMHGQGSGSSAPYSGQGMPCWGNGYMGNPGMMSGWGMMDGWTPPADLITATPAASSGGSGGAAAAGDPARGKAIFNGQGMCFTCHKVSTGNTIVGPSLKGVASRAGTRKSGMLAQDYLHESIVSPNAFVVPGFVPGIMPQNFGQVLTPQQISDVIAYLLTLR